MNIYQEATRLKIRFNTSRGMLSTEQLWDLPMTTLGDCIKSIKKQLKADDSDDLGFLDETKVVDAENQLRFEVLKDIYLSKKKENEEARNAQQKKANNQKIMELIQQKKDEKLKDMSVEELEKLLQ